MTSELCIFGYIRESFLCSHDFFDSKDVDDSIEVNYKGLVDRDIELVIGLGKVLGKGKIIDFGSFFWR